MPYWKDLQLYHPEVILGEWDVKYPGADGMIVEGHAQRLVLAGDGTFTWNPAPKWAKHSGMWGLAKSPDDELLLCFEDTEGELVCAFLVPFQFEGGGPIFLNWQQTRTDAVVFADRIFRADRPVE